MAATAVGLAQSAEAKDGDIPKPLWSAYTSSIRDAAVAEPDEVVTDLLVPTPGAPLTEWKEINGQQYLLVSSLRFSALSDAAAGEPFTLSGDRWVSVPGELERACRQSKCSRMSNSALDMRIKQILGLPPDANYGYVNRFWVRTSDMFRPCTDPQITSSSCPTEVPAGLPASVAGISTVDFLWKQANYAWRVPSKRGSSAAISCAADFNGSTGGQCLGFPWTRLGYTYDWAPGAKDDRGVTEFVVPKGTVVYMESVTTQREIVAGQPRIRKSP